MHAWVVDIDTDIISISVLLLTKLPSTLT
jgi:hypothetical protein